MAKRIEIFRNISKKTEERAVELTVMELGNEMFAVSSYSKPSGGHLVSIQGGYNCDCIGFNRHADCSHIFAVQTLLANKKES